MLKLLALTTLAAALAQPQSTSGGDLQQVISIGMPANGQVLTVLPLPVTELLLGETPPGIDPVSTYNYMIAYTVESIGDTEPTLQVRRTDSPGPGTASFANSEAVSGFGLPSMLETGEVGPLRLDFLSPSGDLVLGWKLEAQ
ncbi:MAG: hypothetical protein P1V81_04425 [Planctomycetota bacterium]|nr:hypothetical protein [Planctomycetota bacterium]